jgi:two-component system, NtrC family, nitrogen regulation response regulator NtrX
MATMAGEKRIANTGIASAGTQAGPSGENLVTTSDLIDKSQVKILIVDDEAPIREVLSASLADEGFTQVKVARSGEEGLRLIEEFRPSIVLLDIWMPGSMDGIEVLSSARGRFQGTEFVIMSGHGNIETAVKAVKLGAWDFVEKPLSIDKILILIHNISVFQSERGEKNALLNKLRKNIAIIGESQQMVALKQMLARVAGTSSWVLITGENGTGKELVAQNIHYLSPRAGRPFVEVNCAAIPEDLIESELFGYEKGAFTGADKARKGKFDHANGGTIFLDEIADMSLKAQAKVLRILQERRFTRVGGENPIEVDVRVVAATNKNLEQEIKEGRFREDLYYRLNVIPCHVPALRERGTDLHSLITHFGEQFSREGGYRHKTFSEKALEMLKAHTWPGNVRELRNFIERIYILTPGEVVDVHDLRFAGLPSQDKEEDLSAEISNFREARARFEKDYLLRKIAEHKGNISKTAEAIGLERSYLHRKIKGYGIDVEEIV